MGRGSIKSPRSDDRLARRIDQPDIGDAAFEGLDYEPAGVAGEYDLEEVDASVGSGWRLRLFSGPPADESRSQMTPKFSRVDEVFVYVIGPIDADRTRMKGSIRHGGTGKNSRPAHGRAGSQGRIPRRMALAKYEHVALDRRTSHAGQWKARG